MMGGIIVIWIGVNACFDKVFPFAQAFCDEVGFAGHFVVERVLVFKGDGGSLVFYSFFILLFLDSFRPEKKIKNGKRQQKNRILFKRGLVILSYDTV